MNVVKTILKTLLALILLVLVALCILSVLFLSGLNGKTENLTRIDDNGWLYYVDYTADYDNDLIRTPARLFEQTGCVAFTTHESETGHVLTGRNYDYPHKDSDGNMTGLNVIVHLTPEGKYSSLNTSDMALMTSVGLPYYAGCLDDGKTTQLPLAFLPYLCVDGVNDQGLVAALLSVPSKEGQEKTHQKAAGKETSNAPLLLRDCLDNCRTVEEAVALAQNVNMTPTLGLEMRLYLCDSSGLSAVLEWQNNELMVIYTDALTNFYIGSDDGADYYKKGVLMEKFEKAEGLRRDYTYGAGYGYGAFNRIVTVLDSHIVSMNPYRTEMTVEEARSVLESASYPYNPDGGLSYTQYSILFDGTDPGITVWSNMDYSKSYTFKVRIPSESSVSGQTGNGTDSENEAAA